MTRFQIQILKRAVLVAAITVGINCARAQSSGTNGIGTNTPPVDPPPNTNTPPSGPSFTVGIVSPTNGQVYTAPASVLFEEVVNGTTPTSIEVVQIFANSTYVTTVTNLAGTNLLSTTLPNASAGSYFLTAVLSNGPGDVSVSEPVWISVVPPTNTPPPGPSYGVGIQSPTNGEVFTAPASIQIDEVVSGASPTSVEVVQIFANSNLVTTVTNFAGTNLFFTTWTNVAAGSYTLSAVISNSPSDISISDPVSISVTDASTNSPVTNTPPSSSPFTVSIQSPTNAQIFTAPASIQLEDVISGIWTSLAEVEIVQFFANSNLVATVTNRVGTNVSYATWTGVSAGTYTLAAVTSDGSGNTSSSEPIWISVTNPQSGGATNTPPSGSPFTVSIQSPTNAQIFTAPASIQLQDVINGIWSSLAEVQIVQFYANSNLVATVTNDVGTNLSFATWTNVPGGTYTLTAEVTDGAGNTSTSTPVSVYVYDSSSNNPPPDTNAPPSSASYGVAIESPTNSEVFTAPASILLEDLVSGTSPTSVEVVQFFANSNLISTVTNLAGTNLFSTTWTNVAAGSYTLTAVISNGPTDIAVSEPVSIFVTDESTNSPAPNAVVTRQPAVVGLYSGGATPMGVNHLVGGCVYLSIPVTNGMSYSLQRSSDLVHWTPVYTNTAVGAASQFVDPSGSASGQFYRIVPTGASVK